MEIRIELEIKINYIDQEQRHGHGQATNEINKFIAKTEDKFLKQYKYKRISSNARARMKLSADKIDPNATYGRSIQHFVNKFLAESFAAVIMNSQEGLRAHGLFLNAK